VRAAARDSPGGDLLPRNLEAGFHPTPRVGEHGETLPHPPSVEHLTAGDLLVASRRNTRFPGHRTDLVSQL